MNPLKPKNEEARLQELLSYHILDTPSEQEYDDITLLASQICNTPIALISLIDSERQWFKSKVGLEVDETTRNIAFCAYAILPGTDDTFVVEDATKDQRFADNPLVTEDPNIRFYAGAPLISSEKNVLGTLCVIDREPRHLTGGQLEALQALARQITMKLELRRVSALLQESNEKLKNLSLTDDLTALFNRRGFLLHAEQQLKSFRARRTEDGLCLMMADVDKLKQINDNFGHEEGSAAIVKVGEIIQKTFRESDIIARIGGDEFVVLIISAPDDIDEKIAERLQNKFDEYNARSGKPYRLAISFGFVAFERDDTSSIEEVMKQADEKMYEQKRLK